MVGSVSPYVLHKHITNIQTMSSSLENQTNQLNYKESLLLINYDSLIITHRGMTHRVYCSKDIIYYVNIWYIIYNKLFFNV